ncbi:MAG TPA: metallophosphoesterase [Candidatus Acidoferrales bacterium]|nr:metallophosphoesterase [Candidatus Acidoferrales bacterium]
MLIVQISDIHVGPEFRDEVFQRGLEEINALKPDVLLVTGDLTENGLLAQYQRAEQLLKQFSCRTKIFTSGNHDYRNTGYLLFKEFFPSKPVVRKSGVKITVVSTARPERNDGEAGHRQIIWLQRELKGEKGFRLVMMHHHLVPVPDTGPNTIPIVDAGDVLRAISKTGADLVVCGHRHRPWRWNLNRIPIISAGSFSSERLRGFFSNSYNIININEGRFTASLKIVDGERLSFDAVGKGEAGFSNLP